MEFWLRLACYGMMTMIECPRCGFAQPQDQYCASCGVNMEQLLAKPKPLLVRVLQNPNFHLSLIGGLIFLVVAWIFYTQSGMVSREVSRMLDLPVSSKDAGDPEEQAAAEAAHTASESETPEESDNVEDQNLVSANALADGALALGDSSAEDLNGSAAGTGSTSLPAAQRGGDATKFEMNSWEIPRESLGPLMAGAQRLGEGNGARAWYWPQGSKVFDLLQTTGQPLGPGRSGGLAANSQLTVETAPTAPEMFQVSLITQVTKFDNKEASLRWSGQIILPQAEPPGSESAGPAMRQVLESNFSGNGTLSAGGLIMIIIDPANRVVRDEYLAKGGEGPWAVFASPEFRAGMTDWVIVLQIK